jgi:hypothetical protein
MLLLIVTGFALWAISIALRTPQTVDKFLKMLIELLDAPIAALRAFAFPLMEMITDNLNKAAEVVEVVQVK